MKLLSIQVGLPRSLGLADAPELMDRTWTSGIHKETITGSVAVSLTGLVGDGQADLKNHGGLDKAINAYPADHFAAWKTELGLNFSAGAFGENFTTCDLLETEACIGDSFKIGDLVVQITQPRQPCWKLARRWHLKDFAARVEQTGRTGWYFRVLETGTVSAPADFVLLGRPHPEWTIAAANEVMYRRKTDWDAALALGSCPALSESWRVALTLRAQTRTLASDEKRLGGNNP